MSDCHQPPYRWAPLSAPAQGKFLWGPAGESTTVCPNGVSKHESGGRLSPCPRSFWSYGSGAVFNWDVNLQRLHSAEPRCLILRACLALHYLGLRISIASNCWELGATIRLVLRWRRKMFGSESSFHFSPRTFNASSYLSPLEDRI